MVKNMNGLSLSFIIHPGETLKEVLEENNMSQEELAIRTGYSAKHVSEVINGKKGISSEFAKKLEYVFSMPMSFWLNLQGIYDKEVLEYKEKENIEEEEIHIVKKSKSIIKLAIENKLIEKTNNVIDEVISLRNLCGINSLANIKYLPVTQAAFRVSKSIDIEILYFWIRINEVLAKKLSVDKDYNVEILKQNINKSKETMFLDINDAIKELTKIFKECGICFRVSKTTKGAPVQGFIKKSNNKVILIMTIRGAFADIFWFTLFHEIGHLINGDCGTELIDFDFSNSSKEKVADDFAKNVLINEAEFIEFLNNKKYTEETINKLAKNNKVLPCIVIGRLEKELNNYKLLANKRARYKWDL